MMRIKVTDYGYGFFPGGDPRDFTPDGDATEEELANHKAACTAWDGGEHLSRPDCAHGEGFVITTCQFGLGTYRYTEEMYPWTWARWVMLPTTLNRLRNWWEWTAKPALGLKP